MDRQTAWDVYFASIVGMSLHPGNPDFSLTKCADLADRMMLERDARKEVLREAE